MPCFRRFVPALLALGIVFGVPLQATPRPTPKPVHLVILHTNDVHGHLTPFEYNGEKQMGGVARRSTLLKRLAPPEMAVLRLDAGDVWERGALSKRYHGQPDVLALNAMQYDAAALGNNEFRQGVPSLLEQMRLATFPFLSANVTVKATGKPLARESVLFRRGGLRIGVIGVTTPRITTYPGLESLAVEDPINAVRRVARRLRPQVDLLIALTHVGFLMDRVMAEQVPELDAIVGGDSHTRLDRPYVVKPVAAPGKAIPIVQAGEYGVRVGRLDLWVEKGRRPGPVVRFEGRLVPVTAALPEDPAVLKLLRPYLAPPATRPTRLAPAPAR